MAAYRPLFPGDLDAALAALEETFTPEVCSRQSSFGRFSCYGGLHASGISHLFRPFLMIGRDLVTIPASSRRELTVRLQYNDSFEGAVFELGIWAALVRAGLFVVYEQTANRPGRGSAPRADLLVHDGGQTIALELKWVSTSFAAQNMALLADELSDALYNAGVRADVVFKPSLAFGKRGTDRLLRESHRAAGDLVTGALSNISDLPRVVDLPGYGILEMSPNSDATLRFDVVQGMDDPVRRAQRVVNRLADGSRQAAQLPAVDLRVVVAQTPTSSLAARSEAEALCRAIATRSTILSRCDAVILLNCSSQIAGWTTDAVIVHVRERRDRLADAAWFKALKSYQPSY